MSLRCLRWIGIAAVAVGLSTLHAPGQATQGLTIRARERGVPEPAPPGPAEPAPDARATINQLRGTLYEAVKREKLSAEELDAARARIVDLESEREVLLAERDRMKTLLNTETMRLQAKAEGARTALKEAQDQGSVAAGQAERMADENRALLAQVEQLREELGRLTRRVGQAPPPAAASSTPPFDTLMFEANRLLRQGDPDAAMERFERALASRPGDARAGLGLASAHYALGQSAEALVRVEDLLDELGDHAEALGLKALIVWRQGDLRQANRLLDRALKLAPDDVRLRNYRGIVAFERRDYRDALKDLDMAVALDPEDPESRFNLAVLLARRPKPDLAAAREHYEAALAFGGPRDEELEKMLVR